MSIVTSPALAGVDEQFTARADVVWMAAAIFIGGSYALLQFQAFGSGLPITDAYFGADVERIFDDLLSTDTSITRTPLHPFFPFIGVFYRVLHFVTRLSNTTLLRGGAFGCGASMALLTYTAARIWGATILTAMAAVALLVSSAAFTYWTSLPETHIWGGLTTLLCIILGRFPPRDPVRRELWSAAIFTISFSVLITNVVVWVLTVSRPVRYSPSLLLITSFIQRNFISLLLAGLAGLGIILLGFSIERALLNENPTIGYLFFVGHEKKWILHGRLSDVFGGLHAMGVIAPTSAVTSAVGNVLGGVVLAATLWVARQLQPQLRLIALFVLWACLLHTVYDRPESFLCSPNYVGVWALLIAVGVSRTHRVAAPLMLIAASIILGVYNTAAHAHSVSMLQLDQLFHPD